jgi:hypothetical protein
MLYASNINTVHISCMNIQVIAGTTEKKRGNFLATHKVRLAELSRFNHTRNKNTLVTNATRHLLLRQSFVPCAP